MGLLEIFKKTKIIIKGHRKEYMKVWFRFFNIVVIIICLRALTIWYFMFLSMFIIIGLAGMLPMLSAPILLDALVMALVIALSINMLGFKTCQANYYQYIKEKDDLK